MSASYIGQILAVGFSFAPVGYLACNGQLLSISGNETLFQLLGTTYGGDGASNFALPNLQGRVPVGQGNNGSQFVQGQAGGQENVTLTAANLPPHTHGISVQSSAGTASSPAGNYLAGSADQQYSSAGTLSTAPVLSASGGSQSHPNLQPYQAINFVICTEGYYPSQS